MKLPPDIAAAVIKAAGQILADRLEAQGLDELQLFTMKDVADRLKVSKGTAIRLVREYVELGEASRRVTPATLRKLIQDRTISG
jgi:transposase